MSKQQRYTEEFKLTAVKQVTERHYPVAEVAERLGVSSHSLYAWISPKCSNSMTPTSKPKFGASRLNCAASPMNEIS
jgi:transposase-like protein